MTLSLLFWILMLLWIVLWLVFSWPIGYRAAFPNLLLFALLAILGWKVFGPAIHG